MKKSDWQAILKSVSYTHLVQIDWDQTQWSDGGLTTPEYYMNVFGRINHIENSGWGVDIPINDDQSINMREMFMLHEPTIDGKPIS